MTSDYVHAHQSSEFNTILRIQCLYIRLAKYNKTVMFCIRLNMHFNGQWREPLKATYPIPQIKTFFCLSL